MKMTKTDFPWKFLWNFVLLFLAVCCLVSQAVHQSVPGVMGFGFIVYILVKLIYLEKQ